VLQADHASLKVFGIGTELSEAEWRGVARQLLAQGLLAVAGEYGTLGLTEASNAVMRGGQSVMLRREPEKVARSSRAVKPRPGADDLAPQDASMFERLRTWRAGAAKEQGVPAYVIFHDATLRQIAADRPTSLAELSHVSGVGEAKLARYGQQVLDTVAG
jgi:ATP-dependent DNA helicase RecQ